MTALSTGYRRLAGATVITTLALIVVGGIVRVSNSGLGCGPAHSGVNGWPLCQGDLVPGIDLNAVIEFAHRVVATAVVVLIFALAVLALRRYRAHPHLLRATIAAACLVLLQAVLGAITVERDLGPALVAGHLALAMILLAVTLYIWRYAATGWARAHKSSAGTLRWLVSAAQFATFAAIVAGGYMAGTEHRGRPDEYLTTGAHYACGPQFPACNGGFLPFGQGGLVDVHLTHRVFVYLTTALVIAVAVGVWRARPGTRVTQLAVASAVLLVCQLCLGALNVWIQRESAALIAAHLTVGTLLWGTLIALGMQLDRQRHSDGEHPPSPAPTEAITA